ncbi:hypothetical protein M3147_05405 [Agromyces mediolanus]|uniref:hypothetical protein n=1 Tax=Agromyces mediolanus TaxID=41986 RepID=UPI002040765F|nr:hypothetical protein [Agromyces mediolanus]MCM3656686.1 hypothetical protein [Agromyces mediolanus]
MSIRTRAHARLGAGLGAGAALAALSLLLTPLAAQAEEPAPADPAAATAPADPAPAAEPVTASEPAPADPAPEPAPAFEPPPTTEPASAPEAVAAPPAVVVAEPGTTAAESLAEPAAEPTVTLFSGAATATAPAAPFAAPEPGDPCYPAVCIDNGTILLAVNPTGELNTPNGAGSKAGPGDAGLDYLPTNNDATSPGCLCEGWGVADPASGVWGGANLDTEGPGGTNLVLESFTHTASTATSVVVVQDAEARPVFRVTHQYVPSTATKNLYQVNVTIENLSGETIATVKYRRVMDWDIEPTAFSEFVTIDGGSASALAYSSDDGFASPNPLAGPSSINFEGNAVDNGPADHGALFDFAFGPLGAGGSLSFVIFYGAAANEAEARAALAAVGAEAYSFGQTSDDPSGGTPNTFIFAFGNVGGAPIFPIDGQEPETPVAAPAPGAPVAVPAAAVEMTEASGDELASTGAEPADGLLAAALLAFAGLGLVTTAAVRRRRA